MIRDATAAIGLHHRHVTGGEDIGAVGRSTQCNHRRVFAQQNDARVPCPHPLPSGDLLGENSSVRPAREPMPPEHLPRRLAREQLVEKLVVEVVQRRGRTDNADAGRHQLGDQEVAADHRDRSPRPLQFLFGVVR